MSDYRRYLVPGGTYFFTLVSYRRRPQFARACDVERLRAAIALVGREQPFRFLGAVVLPEPMHFLWTLPPGDVWQRRLWEHTIDEVGELEAFLDYIHYDPVKHRLASCPHAWPASSFSRWVERGPYQKSWGCCCHCERPGHAGFQECRGTGR